MPRKILSKISLTLGILLLINGIVTAITTNLHTGVFILLAISVALIVYGIFYAKIKELTSKGIFRVLKYIAGAILLFFIALIFIIAINGREQRVDNDRDAIIVLGAGIKGEKLSKQLTQRLEQAYDYHTLNPNSIIVVSGGQGPQEDIPEAVAMKKFLLEKGVPAEKIVTEEKATSTFENFKFTKEILDNHFDNAKIAFVTSDYHMLRATKVAKSVGFTDMQGILSKTDWYSLPLSYIRETLAVIKFWTLGY